MAMEVEEAFPSFSTERIRSKMQVRDGPVPQRRLDYNAPLLSVRRLADLGADANRKVWKLSGELSKEPLRVPGAVPFTWEHSPGRPKQPESPPRAPSSPSPPSTPSPPSSRRASPASPSLPPAPLPYRPLFIRSNSSTIFAPPPPPPPPPPPLPRIHPLPVLTRRRSVSRGERHVSTSFSPTSPPLPPPPPPPPTISHVPKQVFTASVLQNLPDHGRMGAFRLVDPSEGFLRLLRVRREKAEPEEFLAVKATEDVVGASREPLVVLEEVAVETSKIQPHHDEGRAEVASINNISSCVVVDAIVQRFLEDHPDDGAEEAVSVKGQDDGTNLQDDQPGIDTVESIDLSYVAGYDDATQRDEDVITGAVDTCSIIPLKEDAGHIPVLHKVCFDHEESAEGESTLVDCAHRPTWENSKLENGASESSVCTPAPPSSNALDLPLEDGGHKQSLIKKRQSRRSTRSIAILDSCRVESFRMIKSALVQLCRKAAVASLRTLGKARRMVAPSRRTSSSLDLAVHCNSSKALDYKGGSSHEEEANTILQERLSQETEHRQSLVSTPCGPLISPPKSPMPHSPRLSPPKSSMLHSPHLSPHKLLMPHSPRLSLPKSSMPRSPHMSPRKSSTPHSPRISPPRSATPHSPHMSLAKSSTPHSPCSPPPKSSTSMQEHRESTSNSLPKPSIGLQASTDNSVKRHTISSPTHSSLDLQPATQGDTQGIRSTTSSARHMYVKSLGGDESNGFSARHQYVKSLGGDEPNEFYDASSRFGSQRSTLSRVNSMNRSMSKDWGASEGFIDATSTPFETPRTSVSDNRYAMSDTESLPYATATASEVVASKARPTSKLSKRVGKVLWVDTREMKGSGKVDAVSRNGFLSGELYTSSNENSLVLNKKEMTASRRKYVSGDQQASSSSTSLSQNKRGISRSTNGKASSTNAIAVTPVFPSKCQKNRSVGSASGLPRQISTGNMADMGWPLGISGYPPLMKTCTKGKGEEGEKKKQSVKNIMPCPPLPPSPAGGSWLRKALSSTTNTPSHAPSRLAGLHAMMASPSSNKKVEPPQNKWEDIVKGSHVQPGHLRFSEELHHHPPSNSNSNKYYVS